MNKIRRLEKMITMRLEKMREYTIYAQYHKFFDEYKLEMKESEREIKAIDREIRSLEYATDEESPSGDMNVSFN